MILCPFRSRQAHLLEDMSRGGTDGVRERVVGGVELPLETKVIPVSLSQGRK